MDSLNPISAHEFDEWMPTSRVIIHDHPRRFASLELLGSGVRVALAWRSDHVEPIVCHDVARAVVWVGVDQHVTCVTIQGTTLFSVGLGSSLLDIRQFAQFTAILCDAQLILVNTDYSIRSIRDLRQVPSTVEMIDDQFVVTFIDGEPELID